MKLKLSPEFRAKITQFFRTLCGRCPYCGGRNSVRVMSQPDRVFCPDCKPNRY